MEISSSFMNFKIFELLLFYTNQALICYIIHYNDRIFVLQAKNIPWNSGDLVLSINAAFV